MMSELKEKPVCCGKQMVHEIHCQSMIHSASADIQNWTCRECGHYITLVEDDMDEEELESWRENDEV